MSIIRIIVAIFGFISGIFLYKKGKDSAYLEREVDKNENLKDINKSAREAREDENNIEHSDINVIRNELLHDSFKKRD